LITSLGSSGWKPRVYMMKQAIVLAAGEGQRLRPFTATRPKVMLEIAGKPILQYVIEALAQNGIRDIVLVVGYYKEQIFDYFGNGQYFGVKLEYVKQDKQLGTAHALAHARDIASDEFMVLAGDNLIDAETITELSTVRSPAILLKKVADVRRYGVVTVENGEIREIIEKPEEPRAETINTGTYIFSKDIFRFIGEELDLPEVVNKMLRAGITIRGIETRGTWLDVVYPWDIIKLNGAILGKLKSQHGGTIEQGVTIKGPVAIGRGTVIRSNSYIAGPVLIGENCDIGPNVCIMPATSLGNNISISPFTVIDNSVIGDDVNIGPASILEDTFIDNACTINGHFTACKGEADIKVDNTHYSIDIGALIGSGCIIGSNVVAQPGVILGNYCTVQPMKIIGGRLPDKARVY
jgi:glucose-1-phosphate thymidylyltransferase